MSDETTYFTIRNWEKYQHYKDRCPPWIKLHYELLTSPDWVMLDDASKLLAVVCMLIASRNNGNIPNNPRYIQKVGQLDHKPVFLPLVNSGFLLFSGDASTLLADASPRARSREAETEAEAEAEAENYPPVSPTPKRETKNETVKQKEPPHEPAHRNKTTLSNLAKYLEHIGATEQHIPHSFLESAQKRGIPDNTANAEWQRFCNHHIGKRSKWEDWGRAWSNWLASVRIPAQQRPHNRTGPDRVATIASASLATSLQRNGLDGGQWARENDTTAGRGQGSNEDGLLPLATGQ